MKPSDRTRLTTALRGIVSEIAVDVRSQIGAPGPARQRALKLHEDEQVGEAFDVWTDLLSRRAAVLWVLKSVYVCRVLEDQGLLTPGRLLDSEAQQLFEKLAPNLGETAFLKWIYRDLASTRGGLPELFTLQPAEVTLPADVCSRKLIGFWRHVDPDTGACWSFANEKFEGELMGDLYQELDPVVKDRFALCQTPDFVRAFILDRTLTPAMETFGADEVRLLDPACGSGHFLIDGLKRLVAATRELHPDRARRELVTHCLKRVVGIDLNDYACGLARARLVMTAAELAGVDTLAEAARFHPQVFWADGLEQVEKGTDMRGHQLELFHGDGEDVQGGWTRPEVRSALREMLRGGFHAVVANPPYPTEKDPAKKEYHRQKVGRERRYVSAYKEYSLGSPFTERATQLATHDGYIGLITSNNFMKREFGVPLIERVLAGVDLSLVVAAQPYIPNHDTPTTLLFMRNRPPANGSVPVVMGKRGEIGTPPDAAKGKVWISIAEGWKRIGFENDCISVGAVPRTTLEKHPWSLSGGGAAELKARIETCAVTSLGKGAISLGEVVTTRQDECYVADRSTLQRNGIACHNILDFIEGDKVRDWAINESTFALFPYDPSTLVPIRELGNDTIIQRLWPYREHLWARVELGGTIRALGLKWYQYSRFHPKRLPGPGLIYSFVATHNNFSFLRGGRLTTRSAPIIKLPSDKTEDDHLVLLGLLNSSTACFWMKQVFHDKGAGTKRQADPAKVAYEFAATGMQDFPIPTLHPAARDAILHLARHLDSLARERAQALPTALPEAADLPAMDAGGLRQRIQNAEAQEIAILRRQIALQEELDWRVYQAYGLAQDYLPIDPDQLAATGGIPLGARPFELLQARGGRELGVDGQSLLAEIPEDIAPIISQAWEARYQLIESNPELALIEHESYKRRWCITPRYLAGRVETFQDRLRLRLRRLLADLVEACIQTRDHSVSVERLTTDLQSNPRFLALAEVFIGRPDFDAKALVSTILLEESVPNHSLHRYSASGLLKRAAWEKTWDDQRREDAGEDVKPELPPTYTSVDFLKPTYADLRGKLDVPKERFIAITEVPGRNGSDTLFGWAGWTPLQRLKALLAIDEDLEDAGTPLPDRIGLLDSAWRLLPDIARDDAPAANRLKAELQALLGPDGPSREMLDEWRVRFPPPGHKNGRPRKRSPGPARARSEPNSAATLITDE